MDKHWENLLIDEPANRRKGLTCKADAHSDTARPTRNQERRDIEMGNAFCLRGTVREYPA